MFTEQLLYLKYLDRQVQHENVYFKITPSDYICNYLSVQHERLSVHLKYEPVEKAKTNHLFFVFLSVLYPGYLIDQTAEIFTSILQLVCILRI